MIMPLSLSNSRARFTLLAGDPSVRTSRLGMASPTLTKAGRVEWKPLVPADRAARLRGRIALRKAIVTAVV